jgi:hypothetical protein
VWYETPKNIPKEELRTHIDETVDKIMTEIKTRDPNLVPKSWEDEVDEIH